jgi:hypothetical protein
MTSLSREEWQELKRKAKKIEDDLKEKEMKK